MRNRRRCSGIAAAAIVAAIGSGAVASAVSSTKDADESVIATFEGTTMRLADGWGPAGACITDYVGTRCYRTATDLEASENLGPNGTTAANSISDAATSSVSCSSAVVLYNLTGHNPSGASLYLSLRSTALNLASYGFNNITSSYTIGACSAHFYDGAAGSTLYPGNTAAWASATSMASGWNNRISTVYIN